MIARRGFLVGISAVGAGVTFGRRAAAGPVTRDKIGDQVQTVPKGELPEFVTTADAQQLYRYAVDHGDDLKYIPCFCGCANVGHTSNRDCYVKAFNKDRTLTFTSHAAT